MRNDIDKIKKRAIETGLYQALQGTLSHSQELMEKTNIGIGSQTDNFKASLTNIRELLDEAEVIYDEYVKYRGM